MSENSDCDLWKVVKYGKREPSFAAHCNCGWVDKPRLYNWLTQSHWEAHAGKSVNDYLLADDPLDRWISGHLDSDTAAPLGEPFADIPLPDWTNPRFERRP